MSQISACTSEFSLAKRRKILAGARQAFTDLGYERASVDLVAARAGVAKATVYNHFEDKKALFIACFSEEADAMRAGLSASLGEPAGDVEAALQDLGEKLMEVLLSPGISALYRHTVAEADRFPELGAVLFERGPAVIYRAVASYLARWHDRGVLRIDDAASAAVQFTLLCQGDLLLKRHLGVLPDDAAEQVQETVRHAVRTFVRAYRP